jgi:hypothetical protein
MLNIRDFSAQPERFHRALRVIKSFLEEEQQEDDLDLSAEIGHIDALIEGNAEPVEEDSMGDALLIHGPDEDDVLVFFIMYKDEAIAGKLYESQREMLYLDERGIGRKDFVDAVMNVFDPSISDDEAEQRYYELRFEGLDMDHICLHRDGEIYVGVAAMLEDAEEEEDGIPHQP